jgi:hypothetical protein
MECLDNKLVKRYSFLDGIVFVLFFDSAFYIIAEMLVFVIIIRILFLRILEGILFFLFRDFGCVKELYKF